MYFYKNKDEITLERLLCANLFVLAGPREKISASEVSLEDMYVCMCYWVFHLLYISVLLTHFLITNLIFYFAWQFLCGVHIILENISYLKRLFFSRNTAKHARYSRQLKYDLWYFMHMFFYKETDHNFHIKPL